MNKWLVSMSAAAVAAGAMAVESANTVGCSTINLTAGKWYMVGIQFEEVGGESSTIKLDDLIKLTGVTAVAFDDQDTDAAEIQYFNGAGYDHFYYISDAYKYNQDGVELGKDCWALDGFEAAGFSKAPGEGFWFHATATAVGENASLTVKGEVKEVSPTTIDFTANKWKIIANPFPVGVNLNDVVTTGVTAVAFDDQDTDAAEIQYFNGAGYDHFYYISDAYKYNQDGVELGKDCWALDGFQTGGDSIPVGGSFWILSKQNGSLTFSL